MKNTTQICVDATRVQLETNLAFKSEMFPDITIYVILIVWERALSCNMHDVGTKGVTCFQIQHSISPLPS
jgi:hypothetical protein